MTGWIRLSGLLAIAVLSVGHGAMAEPSTQASPMASPSDHHDQRWQSVKDEIWSHELSIYAGRSHGDLKPYLASTARGYLAWPPFDEVPRGNNGLKATGRAMAGKTHEKLKMTFLDMSLNGDTAVIYYKTHRTMLADGTPVDQRYEVTHTWVKQDGQWKVLGGMARARPQR